MPRAGTPPHANDSDSTKISIDPQVGIKFWAADRSRPGQEWWSSFNSVSTYYTCGTRQPLALSAYFNDCFGVCLKLLHNEFQLSAECWDI